MKTAGVVFDFYDDPTGQLVRKVFPKQDSLPEVVKTAHILSPEERDVLRDEAFALVMVNDSRSLRKFACVDPGNTLLSMLYFEESAERLPMEAVKVAAANLQHFCEEFDLEPTDLVKTAAKGMSRMRDPMNKEPPGGGNDWAHTNLTSINGPDTGTTNAVSSTMKTAESVQGGSDLTDQKRVVGVHAAAPNTQTKKTLPMKNAVGHGTATPTNEGAFPKLGQAIDVTGKSPVTKTITKIAQFTALGGKYPLDSYGQVQKAVAYFDENYAAFLPEERHEFAVKTASRAEELGIPVSERVERYGSVDYSPDILGHLAARREAAADEFKDIYLELQEKIASVPPEEFAKMLDKVDRFTGVDNHWDSFLSDPYYATFGGMSEKKAESSYSWTGHLGDHVSGEALKSLALNGKKFMCQHFSEDVISGFQKDPIGVFQSMPDPQKVIFSHLAEEFSGF